MKCLHEFVYRLGSKHRLGQWLNHRSIPDHLMQLNGFKVHRQSQTIFHVYVHIHVLSALAAENTLLLRRVPQARLQRRKCTNVFCKASNDNKYAEAWRKTNWILDDLLHRKSCSRIFMQSGSFSREVRPQRVGANETS